MNLLVVTMERIRWNNGIEREAGFVLRWLIQQGVVVIPKSVDKERLSENIAVFDFELSLSDMEDISTLDTNSSLFFSHRDPTIIKWFSTMIR